MLRESEIFLEFIRDTNFYHSVETSMIHKSVQATKDGANFFWKAIPSNIKGALSRSTSHRSNS